VTKPAVLTDRWQYWRKRVDERLKVCLPLGDSNVEPFNLYRAMRYVALGKGKRFRAALVYATGESLGAKTRTLDCPACAVELIHAFSLVHDDLPAMDNDSIRRGKPSCHVEFGEATAILAGDALQSLAFDLLASDSENISLDIRLRMVQILAQATGAFGMAGGQAIDLSAISTICSQSFLENMHRMKTGALIAASVQLGAQAAGNTNPDLLSALEDYGLALGLAFQVTDDILDDTPDARILGKTGGSDRRNNKPTFLTVLGESEARAAAIDYRELALSKLTKLPMDSTVLVELTKFVTRRHN